jgi:hypothetical protein
VRLMNRAGRARVGWWLTLMIQMTSWCLLAWAS